MSERSVPPLPTKKPPVPLSFKLSQLFAGKGGSMIPSLTLQGGAAAPATSGGIGTQGNIGNTTITKKSGVPVWIMVVGVVGFLAWKKWGK